MDLLGLGSSLAGYGRYCGISNSYTSPYWYRGISNGYTSPYRYHGISSRMANSCQYTGNRLSFSEALSAAGKAGNTEMLLAARGRAGSWLPYSGAYLAARGRAGSWLPYSEAYLAARGRNGFPAYGLWTDGSSSAAGVPGRNGKAAAMGTSNVPEGYFGNWHNLYRGLQPRRYGGVSALLSPQAQTRLESAIGTDAVKALPELLQEMQEYPESAKDIVGQWIQLWKSDK